MNVYFNIFPHNAEKILEIRRRTYEENRERRRVEKLEEGWDEKECKFVLLFRP
jgi:hypothetical protein